MIKGPDAHSEQFLNDLAALNDRIGRAQRQISSGRRVNAVSDAPDEISYLLSLRTELGATEQKTSNLGRVKTEVDAAEQALSTAATIMDRVQVLGAQGASDLVDADNRITISAEVEQLLGQLVNLSNSEVEGRFVFAGDTDQSVPYTFDASQSNPVSTFQGSTTTRQIEHPSGSRFATSRTAAAIFEDADPSLNIFGSITELRNALKANDTAAIRLAVANVRSAGKHLNNSHAFYGGIQNQVAAATDFASKQQVRLKQQLSEVEDADVTAAIVELTQVRQLQETALAAEARRPQGSLFDYLR